VVSLYSKVSELTLQRFTWNLAQHRKSMALRFKPTRETAPPMLLDAPVLLEVSCEGVRRRADIPRLSLAALACR
jgi:hypothetical protein